MNRATGLAAVINYQVSHFLVKSSFFHSTTVLERRRRAQWDSGNSFKSSPKKFNQYYRRLRKQSLLHDVSEFAEHLFQSWKSDSYECNQPRGQWNSWFRPGSREDRYKRERPRKRTYRVLRRDFDFCLYAEDDDIFHSALGGNPHGYWSFTSNDEDEPRYKNSSGYSRFNKTFNSSRFNFSEEYDSEYDSSSDHEKPNNHMTSDRLALGLSAMGPLNLEDIKHAYRACALKWHPDRHQGSSKVVAEEKFKACSAAYQSLCNELA